MHFGKKYKQFKTMPNLAHIDIRNLARNLVRKAEIAAPTPKKLFFLKKVVAAHVATRVALATRVVLASNLRNLTIFFLENTCFTPLNQAFSKIRKSINQTLNTMTHRFTNRPHHMMFQCIFNGLDGFAHMFDNR